MLQHILSSVSYSSVKPWMQKYCKCGQNCGCTSAVYAAFRMILIRAFQQHIICGIIWIICKVIAYSIRGMLKPHLHKSCICGTRIGINHGFLMTYYICHYVKYIRHYKAFFTGYPKTAFTQVLYMCHKLWMQ